jgi:hypothetical protein
MDKLTAFNDRQVIYTETIPVKDGVECDTYSFVGDDTEDLGIVRVARGFKAPMQKILQGDKTTEGYFAGKRTLTIRGQDDTDKSYSFDPTSSNKEVEVQIGQIMQWTAPNDADLIFYEICDPPYQDGRFEDLKE